MMQLLHFIRRINVVLNIPRSQAQLFFFSWLSISLLLLLIVFVILISITFIIVSFIFDRISWKVNVPSPRAQDEATTRGSKAKVKVWFPSHEVLGQTFCRFKTCFNRRSFDQYERGNGDIKIVIVYITFPSWFHFSPRINRRLHATLHGFSFPSAPAITEAPMRSGPQHLSPARDTTKPTESALENSCFALLNSQFSLCQPINKVYSPAQVGILGVRGLR